MDRTVVRELASQIQARLSAQDWKGALEDLTRYCDAFPNDRKCWYLRAFAEWQLGNAGTARTFVDRALTVSPDYAKARELKERLEAEEESFLSDDLDLDATVPIPPTKLQGGDTPPKVGARPGSERSVLDIVPMAAPAGEGQLTDGRYRVTELLGTGGMGQVWKAADTQLHERPVAIKRVHRHLLGTPEAVQRFEREVKTLASLTHPYIVGVTDTGHDERGFYYVMEYVTGSTLREWLDEHIGVGRPPFREILPLFTQMARAVAFAHARGIIHRDLKPENMVVTPDGALQMLDFGMAKAIDDKALTRDGSTGGPPLYMSPEQARGGDTDKRTDVYALGVILFELATLKPPFDGKSWMELAHKHLHDPPPSLRDSRPDAPPDLDSAAIKALQKEPDRRHQDAKELLTDVQSALSCAVICAPCESNEGIFRQLAEAAWADGVLADEEKSFLLARADDMDIAAERAKEILFDTMP